MELYKRPFVKANTYNGTYLAPVERHLIPHFGNMALDDIKPVHIQQYINKMSETYAPETVKKDFAVLAFIMQLAVDNGLCKTNPASASIRLPKYTTVHERTNSKKNKGDGNVSFIHEIGRAHV